MFPSHDLCGYLALSKKLKVGKEHLKEIFQLIGTVGKEFRKTIINFKERSLSADDFTKEYPEESYLISPIFPEEGLVVLAGKSKIGKSWLVDDMAYAIVNGEEFLGHTCRQGNVLLLALEDGFAKFHVERIKKMKLHIKPNKPTTFVEEVPCIDKGFEESVEQWVNDTPDAKLVIVEI